MDVGRNREMAERSLSLRHPEALKGNETMSFRADRSTANMLLAIAVVLIVAGTAGIVPFGPSALLALVALIAGVLILMR